MFFLVAAYQLRISLDTVHSERKLDFYIPFLLETFTDHVDAGSNVASWDHGRRFDAPYALRSRDELLSVNGREFRGLSVYLQEVSKSQHRPPPAGPNVERHTFNVTIRSSDSRIHDVEFGLPHCTCGVPSVFEAASLWIIPPMFCVLLGFLTAFFRPRSLLAWTFLGAMLS